MKRRSWGLVAVAMVALAGSIGGARAACDDDAEFTSEFRIEDCTFSPRGGNPYFSLEPGHRLVLENEAEGEVVQITVLPELRWVTFETPSGETLWVQTRVIEEREWADDELIEVSHNFFSRCEETGDVYYFGEEVDIYEEGEIVSHDGAWLAGVDGAFPGIIMPGTFLLGSRYFQEQAPGALDRAEHTASGLSVELIAGDFEGCVEVTETNGVTCDPEGDTKVYCPGVGLAVDAEAELAEFSNGDDENGDDERSDDRGGRGRRR